MNENDPSRNAPPAYVPLPDQAPSKARPAPALAPARVSGAAPAHAPAPASAPAAAPSRGLGVELRVVAIYGAAIAGGWLWWHAQGHPGAGGGTSSTDALSAARPPASPRPASSSGATALPAAAQPQSPALSSLDLVAAPGGAQVEGHAVGAGMAAAGLAAARPDVAMARPPWARRQPGQTWSWPTRMRSMLHGGGVDLEADANATQRLIAWYPSNPEGRRLLYSVEAADGSEQRVYEPELNKARALALGAAAVAVPQTVEGMTKGFGDNAKLAEIRQKELDALVHQKNAAQADAYLDARGRPMAELTYADGHKEVVPYDPLIFDLRGRGVQTDGRRVLFDLAGSGKQDKQQSMSDIGGDTALLVFDATRSGRPGKTGAEVFGDRTDLDGMGRPNGYANGFQALRGMVEKAIREDVLPASTLDKGVLDGTALKALEQAYDLKVRIGGFHGRAVSLAEAGIAGIALSSESPTQVRNYDGRGNDLLLQPGAVFLRTDGSTGSYANVFLAARTGGLSLRRLARRPR